MLITDYPPAWYAFLAVWLVVWLVLFRRGRDIRGNLAFGLIGLCAGVAVELLAVFLGLWSYSGGNWPVILWPAYFLASMVWHEIFRFSDGRLFQASKA